MIKRILLRITLCLLVFILSACQTNMVSNTDKTGEIIETLISTITPQEPITNKENTPIGIPIDSVNGLTSEKAVNFCQIVLGEKDDENFILQLAEVHTGRNIGYRCDGTIECNGNQYYIICILWSDNDDIVWSTIGFLGISANGSEIYDAFRHKDETYSLNEIIWSENSAI